MSYHGSDEALEYLAVHLFNLMDNVYLYLERWYYGTEEPGEIELVSVRHGTPSI